MLKNIFSQFTKNKINILIIIIVCILLYFINKILNKSNKEGFQEEYEKELKDLLDKIKIKEYSIDPIWNNKLYNNQPKKKETELSIWQGLKFTGQEYKLIGHSISDSNEYIPPKERTMLIKGDTMPPEDSKLLFEFPHNFFTLPKLDTEGIPLPDKNVYTGITSYVQIEDRIKKLKAHYNEIQEYFETQMAELEKDRKLVDDFNNYNLVEVYGSESFFKNPVQRYLVKHGDKIRIPNGSYNSIRLPVGSDVVLYSTAGGSINVKLDMKPLLNENLISLLNNSSSTSVSDDTHINPGYQIEDSDINKFFTSNGLSENQFNIFGDFAFGKYGDIGPHTNKLTTDESPNHHNYTKHEKGNSWDALKIGMSGTSNSDSEKQGTHSNYTYQRRYGTEPANDFSRPHGPADGGYRMIGDSGRSDLVSYFENVIVPKSNTAEFNNQIIKHGNITVYKHHSTTKNTEIKPVSSNLHLLHQMKGGISNKLKINTDPTKLIKKRVISFINENFEWYDNDISVFVKKIENPQANINDIISTDPEFSNCQIEGFSVSPDPPATITDPVIESNCEFKFYDFLNDNDIHFYNFVYDMSFTLQTWKRHLLYNSAGDAYADGHYQRQASKANLAYLHSNQAFGYGKLKSADITINFDKSTKPELFKFNVIYMELQNAGNTILSNIEEKIKYLEDLKFKIDNNQLGHFPMKIYRPIPPKGYVALGDIVFNHNDVNFNFNKPVISMIATIPNQCVREIREWQMTDKIYTYDRDDKYLSLFLNPYSGTFFAVTERNRLPPGKLSKVVACVKKCELLDNLIESDKCARKFQEKNKDILNQNNLDLDLKFINKENIIYENKIQSRENNINMLKETARRLQIQDDKANIVNQEYNKSKLNNLLDTQRNNIQNLTSKLKEERDNVDINVNFDLVKFINLVNNIPPDTLPPSIKEEIFKKVVSDLPNVDSEPVLAQCPDINTEGLIKKALVESGCYNCTNLK